MTNTTVHPSLRKPAVSRIDRSQRTFINILILGAGTLLIGLFIFLRDLFFLGNNPFSAPAIFVILSGGVLIWQAFRARQGEQNSAIVISLSFIFATIYFVTFTIAGLGTTFAVITLIIGFVLVAQGLPQHQVLQGVTLVSLASLGVVLIDLFLTTPRTTISSFLFYSVTGMSGIIIVLYLILLARDFQNYDLRFKFIASVTALAMVSIVVTTILVSVIVQNILTDEVGNSIHDVTVSRASSMGEALAREVNLLQTVSLNPIVRREMILQNVDYGDTPRTDIIRQLETLDDDWRNTPSATDDILFDEKLNSAAARELRSFQDQFVDNLELFITDRYGGLVAASQRPDRYFFGNDTWWRGAYKNGEGAIYISEPTYNAVLDTYEVTIALPFYDRNDNNLLGIIHASYSLNELLGILLLESDEVLGEEGHMDLIFQNLVLSPNEDGTNYDPLPLADSVDARQALRETDALYAIANVEGSASLVAESEILTTSQYDVINELGWAVLAHLPETVALQSITAQQRTQILLGVLILAGGIIAAALVGRIVARPILDLTNTAQRIAAGDLSARAEIKTGDEIAQLALAFNEMTGRLQRTQQNLESRVAERTHALELSAQISRSLSTIVDREELVLTVVQLLQEAFDYYHVHIYLVDEANERLVMVGGTGEIGQELLSRGHSLKVGQGLVGRAADTNSPVLIPDVSTDDNWVANPLLPDTQAELAVPIAIGGQVLGVLDVQNQEVNSLDVSDVDLVGSIANQVAIGLRNSDLYRTLQQDAEREAVINQITQKIQNTADVSSALKIAVREIGVALNATETAVRLNTGQKNGRNKS